MAKRFTAAAVKRAKPGKHYGPFGLTLRKRASGSGRWTWIGTVRDGSGRRVEIGLGSTRFVSPGEAQEAAYQCAKQAASGIDPRRERKQAALTLRAATEAAIRVRKQGRRNPAVYAGAFRRIVGDYAGSLANRPVDSLTAADLTRVLLPVWTEKPATGRKLRQYLGIVLSWAESQGHRQPADNPMKAVACALPKQPNGNHNRMLAPAKLPAALRKIRGCRAMLSTRLAIVFQALTATRGSEVKGATWAEVKGDVWTIPPTRAKNGERHRVPLSAPAMDVLREAKAKYGATGLIFPGAKGKQLSPAVFGKLFVTLGIEATPHSLRASFRTWTADEGEDRRLAEAALGHRIGSDVERSYARSDRLQRRRELLERWGAFLAD